MATKGIITTKGFEEYLENVARAGRDVDKSAQKALLAGGQVALDGMQRRVPKDTKNLEDHLDVMGPFQDGNYSYVEIGLQKDTDADTMRYGNAQEYGTANMPAQSYIRATMSGDKAKIRQAIRESLKADGVV
jgi:HK97 gp10 family phage protein